MKATRSLPAVICVAALLASPTVSAEAKYKWTLTTFVPESNQVFIDYVQVFVDRVHELTEGEVEIRPFGAGVLAGAFEGYRAVQQGTADLAFMYPPFITNEDPANAVLGGMPGGMSPMGMLNWLFESDGQALWTEFRRTTMGLQPVIAGAVPTEIFLHSHKPINAISDFEGMRIRTAGAWADIVRGFGATPTVVPPAEIFTMLERKGVDAIEFVTAAGNEKAGYHNVAKYIIVPGVHQPSGAYEVVMKSETWDALPERIQTKIMAAGRLATMESFLKTTSQDVDSIQNLLNGKNEVIKLPDAVIATMVTASHEWASQAADSQKAKGNEWMSRIYGSYSAYQNKWNASADFRWLDLVEQDR